MRSCSSCRLAGMAAAGPWARGDLGDRLRIVGTVRRFDEQVELVPGPANEPRQGDAILRAEAVERVGGGET